jgi:peptidyl-prolyl cis-trans isomerase D
MLQVLRNKAQSTIMQAVVVIIALVFIFWGVGSRMMSGGHSAIKINNEEISFQQFQKAYDQALTHLRDQFNGAIPQGFAEKIGIKQQVISKFVQDSLLRQGAVKMGIVISPTEVQELIQRMEAFQDSGSFNLERYKSILAKNNFTPHNYEESIRHDMLGQRAFADISAFASIVTDRELEDLYGLEKETISVSFAKISPVMFTDKVHVTDQALASWFESAKDSYKTDPQLKLKYLSFDFNDIAKKIVIDDESAKKYYDSNLSSFTIPEQRRARLIHFKVDKDASENTDTAQREKAEEVLKLARSGKDFAQLADQYSDTKTPGGDLGPLTRGKIIEPLDDTIFSLHPGEISDVVRSQFGYHIIKLEGITPEVVRPFSEVHNEIVRHLQMEQAKSMAFELANQCYEGIISAGSLKSYIDSHPGTTVLETAFFTHNSPPEGIKNDQKLLDTAFSLKQGELSSLIETNSGYAILFADKIVAPVVPPLDDIEDRVTKDYIATQAAKMAKEAAENILAQAKTGGDFAKLATEAGAAIQPSGPLSKSGPAQKSPFPSSLLDEVFQLSEASPYPHEPGHVGGDYYVYTFTGCSVPTMDINPTERDQYRNALLQLKQQQIVTAWINNQRSQATVTTHKGL